MSQGTRNLVSCLSLDEGQERRHDLPARLPFNHSVPDDMTHAAELRNMDDYMRFDWAEHARLILETNNNQPMEERTPVIEHCFEENRCKKIKADTNGKWWRRREEIQMLHDENRYR